MVYLFLHRICQIKELCTHKAVAWNVPLITSEAEFVLTTPIFIALPHVPFCFEVHKHLFDRSVSKGYPTSLHELKNVQLQERFTLFYSSSANALHEHFIAERFEYESSLMIVGLQSDSYTGFGFSPRNLKRESGLSLTPVLTLWGGAILTVTYGGELLYLWIWRDHSAWYSHIIVTAWFTTR